jgi:hypothetical protein
MLKFFKLSIINDLVITKTIRKSSKKIQLTCNFYKLNFRDTMANFLRENLHRSHKKFSR